MIVRVDVWQNRTSQKQTDAVQLIPKGVISIAVYPTDWYI